MVAAIAAAALAAMQIFNGIKQADDIRSANELNKMLDGLQAEWIEKDAWEAEQYGYTQASRYQSMIDTVVGDQRVGFAGQGVDVSFGTAAAVQEETRLNGFLNQIDIIQQSRNEAKKLRRQAISVRFGAEVNTATSNKRANSAENTGYLNAAQTGLSAYGNYSSGYSPGGSGSSPYYSASKASGDAYLGRGK